jgi:hypothetical protein
VNTKMLKLARLLWSCPDVPREINRANAIKWIRSIRQLGDRWLLAKTVGRA